MDIAAAVVGNNTAAVDDGARDVFRGTPGRLHHWLLRSWCFCFDCCFRFQSCCFLFHFCCSLSRSCYWPCRCFHSFGSGCCSCWNCWPRNERKKPRHQQTVALLFHCCDSTLLGSVASAGSAAEPERDSATNSPSCQRPTLLFPTMGEVDLLLLNEVSCHIGCFLGRLNDSLDDSIVWCGYSNGQRSFANSRELKKVCCTNPPNERMICSQGLLA